MDSFSHKLFNCSFALVRSLSHVKLSAKRTDEQLNSFFINKYSNSMMQYIHCVLRNEKKMLFRRVPRRPRQRPQMTQSKLCNEHVKDGL